MSRARPFIAACLAAIALPVAAQKTELLVYTALETDQVKAYQEGFNKAYPDIEIKWVRDSTGVITAKLLAEKANPQADARSHARADPGAHARGDARAVRPDGRHQPAMDRPPPR